jgi:putative pyruvate formate lyase activating enzyme
MPGETEDAKNIIQFIVQRISPDTYLNIMPQYHPCGQLQDTPQFDRRLYMEEYEEVVAFARDQGMGNLL